MPWCPAGAYVWDSWFLPHAGALHAFYLEASTDACAGDPERRHDLSRIGHATLTAGGFEAVGPGLDPAPPGAWDDLALWTGSVVAAEPAAPFALFYTARRRSDALIATPHEHQRPQHIGVAYSLDLRTWERSPRTRREPVLPNPGPGGVFDGVAWRDPYVLRDGHGRFHAFVCARLGPEHASPGAGGAIAHVTGRDPETWEAPRLLLASDEFYQLEVPQFFWRREGDRKRGYLIFSAQEKDCSPRRRARTPSAECQTGTYVMISEPVPLLAEEPPAFSAQARLLAPGLYAGRLVDAETDIPLLFGFPWPSPGQPFRGGIEGPLRVRFVETGALELVDREAPWPA